MVESNSSSADIEAAAGGEQCERIKQLAETVEQLR